MASHSPRHWFHVSALACGATIAGGCAGTQMPNWYHPGPAGYQRYNALTYDPYPLRDIGPDVAGGRPREYDREIPEAERNQKNAPRPAGVRPLPMPSFSLPTIVTPATGPAPPAPPPQPVFPTRPPY